MKRRAYLSVVGAAAAAVAGCTSRGQQSGDWDVRMSASDFIPGELEVTVGTTVVWRNTGSRQHTVTAYETRIPDDADYFASGGFDGQTAAEEGWRNGFAGGITPRESYEHTFEVPGRYDYFCVPHEARGMVGTVVVTE